MAENPEHKSRGIARAEHRAELQTTTLLKVEELTDSVEQNTAEVTMLRHDVARQGEQRSWRSRALWLATAIVAGVLSATPFVLIEQSHYHHYQRQTSVALMRIRQLNQTFVECTTPDNPQAAPDNPSDRVHECYDDNLRQRDAFLEQLVERINRGR